MNMGYADDHILSIMRRMNIGYADDHILSIMRSMNIGYADDHILSIMRRMNIGYVDDHILSIMRRMNIGYVDDHILSIMRRMNIGYADEHILSIMRSDERMLYRRPHIMHHEKRWTHVIQTTTYYASWEAMKTNDRTGLDFTHETTNQSLNVAIFLLNVTAVN